eukprot:6181210-Pleurochrysis_carterae.AAC.2
MHIFRFCACAACVVAKRSAFSSPSSGSPRRAWLPLPDAPPILPRSGATQQARPAPVPAFALTTVAIVFAYDNNLLPDTRRLL